MPPPHPRKAAALALAIAATLVGASAGAQPGKKPPGVGAGASASAGSTQKGGPKKPGGADTPKVDPKKLEEARKHMEAGAAFYHDPNGHKCEEAYREFQKAYELSGSLNALRAMGICALELERDGEAIERLESYLAGKGDKIEASDKAQIESDLKALRAAVARVTLRSNRPSFRVMDVRTPMRGTPVRNDYSVQGSGASSGAGNGASSGASSGAVSGAAETTLGIHPGQHTFTATAEGEAPVTWTVEIANGGTYEHTFEFGKAAANANEQGPTGPDKQAPPSAERPVPVTVFVFGGLTAALAVPTAIFMVRASGLNSDYETQNGLLPATDLERIRADVQSANLVADIFLGATVVSLITTGIFYATRPSRPADTTGAWSVSPAVGRTGAGAALVGRF